ncbi:tol-pal system-associated acyl-CoA thioesterase [Kosakonia cowanii]
MAQCFCDLRPGETEWVIILMQTDLSVWGMYQHADIVVKIVMIGLILASVVTWALFFSKSVEILGQKRRLKREQQQLADARSLDQATEIASTFHARSLSAMLINEAQNELELSAGSEDNEGIKERTGFRLERRVAATGRHMGRGNGFLATIGAISPFIGLFGTVWGIMNSFIGIAQTQTTNLAVVAPGIAEALLATAIGLVAAIPAVVIYNIFARMIGNYKANLGDVAAQVLLLQSRDLDLAASNAQQVRTTQKLRVG